MEFVCNANFKGEFDKSINLRELHKLIPNSRLHIKPFQLVVRDLSGTLILFSNGKFRTMGCNDEFDASLLASSYLHKLTTSPSKMFPCITLQSYTLRLQLGFRVNLEQMSSNVPCLYEPELFPTLRLKEFKPISVNLFTTGKVMVCGVRDADAIHPMFCNIKRLCEPYKIQL
jgi:TATA-box binding protein (TBP) (component of TFIID and TFIIIB)